MEYSGKSREGHRGFVEKVKQIGRVWTNPERSHAIVKISEFRNLNVARINELLGTDFKVVILDIDEAIAPHHGEILRENIEKVRELVRAGIEIAVYSNRHIDERYRPLIEAIEEEGGTLFIHDSNISKPAKEGFEELIEHYNKSRRSEGKALYKPDNFLMAGDNLNTDGGCTQAGIPFALITKPVPGGNKFLKALTYTVHGGPRRISTWVSGRHDKKHFRAPLTDEDMLS